jgi:uncharacterized protein (DUF302 family)
LIEVIVMSPSNAVDPPVATYAVERVTVATNLTYQELIAAFERELGRFKPDVAERLHQRRAPWNEAEAEFTAMAGPHGLMIFFRVEQGQTTMLKADPKSCALYLVGNPVIAEQIISIDVRGSFYVPFRVCVYDPCDGRACIAYDRPSSFLAALERPELASIGELLDGKMEAVLAAIQKRQTGGN